MVIILQIVISLQCYATSANVDDATFLDEIEFSEFSCGKSESYYKIYVDKKAKKILLKLSFCDYRFTSVPPEIVVVFGNGDGSQINISSASPESKGDGFSCNSNFQYFSKSKSVVFNIEIAFLSSTYYDIAIECNILGTQYKVCPSVQFDLSPPTTTEKTTTTKQTTTKLENTTTENITTIKSTTQKSTTSKSATNMEHPNKTSKKGNTSDFDSNKSSQDIQGTDKTTEIFTKLEPTKLSKKAETSIVLAGATGVFSIITIVCALVDKRNGKSNATKSSHQEDEEKKDDSEEE